MDMKKKWNPKKSTGPKNKNTKKKNEKSKDPNRFAWKTVKPKPGQKVVRWEGNDYQWCPYHKKWTVHKPEDCRLKDRNSTNKEENKKVFDAIYEEEDEQSEGLFNNL